MRRREFMTLLAKASALGLLPYPALAAGDAPRLVVVLLRGGLDGLGALPPLGDPYFRLARPNLALPLPGAEGAPLVLDENVGLHPALASLHDFWKDKSLAFVPGCAVGPALRPHREAEDFLESALPLGRGGWLNRLLAELRRNDGEAQAVSFCPSAPAILSGKLKTQNISASQPAQAQPPKLKNDLAPVLERLYAGDGPLSKAYRQAAKDRDAAIQTFERQSREADAGSAPVSRFPELALEYVKLAQSPKAPRLAVFSLGGFDTHYNQGAAEGLLADRLRPLGDGLAILARTLGPLFESTLVVVLSEFGRGLLENDYQGTDHARGGLLWLLGPKVAGGKLYGAWPKFDQSYLLGREIEPYCDFRDALWPLLAKHFSLPSDALARVFPAYNLSLNLGDLHN